MRPLTDALPKPLLPVGGQPLIVWHIKRLVRAGLTQIVVNHAWLGRKIEAALGTGAQYGASLTYSAESVPLETAGGIAQALPLLGDEPFLVVNGDVWCDWNPDQSPTIAQALLEHGRQAWLLLVDNPEHHSQGDFTLLEDGSVLDGPAGSPPLSPRTGAARPAEAAPGGGECLTFAGVGIYTPQLFSSVAAGRATPLAPLLRAAMRRNAVIGSRHPGTWVDVGTPERLRAVDALLRS